MGKTRNVIGFPAARLHGDAVATTCTQSSARDAMSGCLLAVAERADREAFGLLFRHFAPRIRTWLLCGGTDADHADEIVQEIFVTVWRKARQYDSRRAGAAAWIYAIARNQRIDMLRRLRRPRFDPDDPAFRPDPPCDGEQSFAARQRADAVRAALASLNCAQREILQLSFYEGESYAAIAVRLGLPVGTVKSRARLAFGHLRAKLGLLREELR